MKEKEEQEIEEEEVEKLFNITWKNWESRRRCEKTYIPEYLKKKNNRYRE